MVHLNQRVVVTMLLGVITLCLAVIAEEVNAISSPRPAFRSFIHHVLHGDAAPCKSLEFFSSQTPPTPQAFEDSKQRTILKRLDNSTNPESSPAVILPTSTAVAVTTSSTPTSTPSATPGNVAPARTSASSSPTTVQTRVNPATDTSASSSLTTSIRPLSTAAPVADVPVTTAPSSSTTVPMSTSTMGSTTVTAQSSQTPIPSSGAAIAGAASSRASASNKGSVSGSVTVFSASPSGIDATPLTSTVLVVVQGVNGPTTSTASVVLWVATMTNTATASTVEPVLQSTGTLSYTPRWTGVLIACIFTVLIATAVL